MIDTSAAAPQTRSSNPSDFESKFLAPLVSTMDENNDNSIMEDTPVDSVPEAASAPESAEPVRSEDLPFLVTHWLAHFQGQPTQEGRTPEERQAIRQIHRAASELSAAFHTLGSFGTTNRVRHSVAGRWFVRLNIFISHFSLLQPRLSNSTAQPFGTTNTGVVPATYSDRHRQWSHRCPPDRLEHLLSSAATTQQVVGTPIEHVDLFQSSLEERNRQIHQPRSGRTLQDAIDVSEPTPEETDDTAPSTAFSGLEHPLALANAEEKVESDPKSASHNLSLVSKFEQVEKESADATRNYLNLRDEYNRLQLQMQGLRKSLRLQEQSSADFLRQRENIEAQNGSMDVLSKVAALDEIKECEQNASRVIAQLKRQLAVLEKRDAPLVALLREAKAKSEQVFNTSRSTMRSFRDPFRSCAFPMKLARGLISRPLGLATLPLPRTTHKGIPSQITSLRRNITMRRMSHAATINTHLAYPIYCLRFDRTGRYFVTGADDYLSRVFCLGSHIHAKSGAKLDPQSYQRGAVLVCTLRGHAGVINDIAVSSDNAFLATASEDGDCRVWGLRDGSPIAILRGHTGGANMVSWSTLTPYRLVTAGADGYARSWDIREACRIRYGAFVGKRSEYKLRKNEDDETHEQEVEPLEENGPRPADDSAVVANGEIAPPAAPAIPLPPLPPGQQAIVAGQPNPAEEAVEEPGQFVAGSEVDEGVILLSRMQHGASLEERMSGHGTRSRRASVKVLCVDVCPLGRYVATGADDGICRVFSASDDSSLEKLDMKQSLPDGIFQPETSLPLRQSSRHLVSGRLLVTLKGHLTAITDLKYSFAGDRLLSASQRDGVVRIWSWDKSIASGGPSSSASPSVSTGGNTYHVNHILIKLTNPEKTLNTVIASQSSRQRPSRTSAASSISCDAAVWSKDDSRVVTSQCELLKQSSSEIQPGSQYIFLWDSFSGQCLLGIHGAHAKQCSVVLPHPFLPSILCTAGADGWVKVWDLEKGESIVDHKNTVDFGPVEARDKGMISGYLDGSFSPDGTELVLADDNGRVTVLDCVEDPDGHGPPTWMREQYFANDYYELCYDRHGYCIERGSEQPPHVAPRGVRCIYSGTPWGEEVTAAFKSTRGPLPESEKVCLWSRLRHRHLSRLPRKKLLKRNVVSQFDPDTTIIIHPSNEEKKRPSASPVEEEAASVSRGPRLSGNYRWRDYADILREEDNDDEADADDDSYELNERSNRRAIDEESEDEDDEESDLDDFESDRSRRRTRRSDPEVRRNRPSRNSRRSYNDLEDSSDEELMEYMSSNNTPSGPFRADYDTHLFRIMSTSGVRSLKRSWVHRIDSSCSYFGRKNYCPQVGDGVVYIPRAHFEVLKDYPTLSPPWQNWPDGAEWPVVRCVVRSLRYRFPFKDFYSRNKSIVVILSLEVTGIPELSHDRELPFPNPVFVDLPKGHLFEVPVFEADSADFIVPIGLYTSRLMDLEKVIVDDHRQGVNVQAFYGNEDEEDGDISAYNGILSGWEEEEFQGGDPNLVGSGFGSLLVSWETPNDIDRLSPWEIALVDPNDLSEIPRPRLSEAEKQQVRDALAKVRLNNDVEEFLVYPVDTSKYTDYESRVENPMWLDFVRTRLDADYYGTRFSVIYDLKLIRDNSRKYNGEDDLTVVASDMYQKFCEIILTDEELADFLRFEKELEENAAHSTSPDEGPAAENSNGGVVRRSRRQIRIRSSLESLPAPAPEGNARRSNRRRASANRNVSILENVDQAAPAVPMNSRNRGRTTRNSRGQQPSGRQWRSTQQSDSLAASQAEENTSRARRASARTRSRRFATGALDSVASRRSNRRGAAQPRYEEPDEDDLIAASELEEMQDSGMSQRTNRREANASARSRNGSIRRNTRSAALEARADDLSDDRQAGSSRRTRSRSSRLLEDPESEEEAPQESSRRRVSSPRSDDLEEDEEPPTRRGRPKRRRTQSDESEASQAAESGKSSAEESDEEEQVRPSSRSRARASPSRRASRAKANTSYLDPSSSEFTDADEDKESDSDASEEKKPAARKRSKKQSARQPPRKKAKPKKESPPRPEINPWPEIPMRDITQVTNEIVRRLSEVDENEFFAVPVAEALPDLADEYLSIVDEPMDFRTILEERMQRYSSIRELQNDLITVFHNCIVYNGEDDPIGVFAQ